MHPGDEPRRPAEMTAEPAPPAASVGWFRQELRYLLEIVALCGFAFAQPLLDTFGRSPETFVFRQADRADIVVFSVLVAFLPPLVLGLGAAVTRTAGANARRWVQVVTLGALAAVVALHALKSATGVRGVPLGLVAIAAGAAFGLAYLRISAVRLWAAFASPAPLIFLVTFLLISPTGELVFADDVQAADIEGSNLPRKIVMIVFDELPTASLVGDDGLIDPALFPNFRRLADESTWYRNHTTVHSSSLFAVPALLSGRYPRDVAPTAENHPQNLFTLLGGAYEVHADEAVTALCPPSVCGERSGGVSALRPLSGDAVDVWREQVSLHDSERQIAAGFVEEAHAGDAPGDAPDVFSQLDEVTETTPARLAEFVGGIRPGGPPALHFLHLLLPHQPWQFYPSGLRYPYPDVDPGQPTFVLGGRWGPEERPAELGRQRHILQTQYVDVVLGQVMAELENRDVYDESLIVVTADHGAVFTPGEEVRPGLQSDEFPAETFDQVMWAPLFIKSPGERDGEVSDANVQSIDLVPTIADRIGVRVPWDVDGVPAGERQRHVKDFFTSLTVPFERTGLGDRYEVPGRRGLRRTLAGGVGAFTHGDDAAWAPYRVGPHADLIGRAVEELPVGPGSDVGVRVDEPGAFADVDLGSGVVPGLLTGDVVTEDSPTVAVAVNGTIAGVSSTFEDNAGPRHFGVLIPDLLFVDGRNEVRLFVVADQGGDVELRPVRVEGLA